MKLKYYLILFILFLILIFGVSIALVYPQQNQPVVKTEFDFRASILGEWLPLDTLYDGVYLNHHLTMTLTDDNGELYLSNSLEDIYPDKCIAEEYNIEDLTCTLYFVYASHRTHPDYCYQIKLIDANTLQRNNFGIDSNGEKSFRSHNSLRVIRKGNEHKYASYNQTLPEEMQNKTWLHLDHYRGNYYYSDEDGYTQHLKTDVDSIAIRDPYNGSLVMQTIKHCRTDKDTVFVYTKSDNTPSYELIWLDKEKGVILFHHPWEDVNFTNKRLLIDSIKYTKELLPTKEDLYKQDLERVAFFEKWKEKGYTQEEIESFRWYRSMPSTAIDMCSKNEDEYYDDGSDTALLSLFSDYNKDGLEDNISLFEDWLYEKDINHDHLDYTIEILDKLDENVYIMKRSVKVRRPMLENFTINIPENGLLELKYDVYANRNYDTWAYKDKTLADVDSINSYTYTYKYNTEINDWNLTKIDAIIKIPGNTKQKSVLPTGRTLYTLEEEMNPLDDIE